MCMGLVKSSRLPAASSSSSESVILCALLPWLLLLLCHQGVKFRVEIEALVQGLPQLLLEIHSAVRQPAVVAACSHYAEFTARARASCGDVGARGGASKRRGADGDAVAGGGTGGATPLLAVLAPMAASPMPSVAAAGAAAGAGAGAGSASTPVAGDGAEGEWEICMEGGGEGGVDVDVPVEVEWDMTTCEEGEAAASTAVGDASSEVPIDTLLDDLSELSAFLNQVCLCVCSHSCCVVPCPLPCPSLSCLVVGLGHWPKSADSGCVLVCVLSGKLRPRTRTWGYCKRRTRVAVRCVSLSIGLWCVCSSRRCACCVCRRQAGGRRRCAEAAGRRRATRYCAPQVAATAAAHVNQIQSTVRRRRSPSRCSCLLICLGLAFTCCVSVVVSSSSSLLLVLLLLLLLCMPPVGPLSCPCRWRCWCSYVDRLEQSLQQRVAQLSKLRGRLNDVVYRHGELVDSVARVQPQLDAKVAEVLQLKASVEADVAALYSKPVHLVGAINALK